MADDGHRAAIDGETTMLDWPIASDYSDSDWPPSTGTSYTPAAFTLCPLLFITGASNVAPYFACLVIGLAAS